MAPLTEKHPIKPTEATWIFVSGETETRHVHDIILGIDSLRKIGVSEQQIFIFADHPQLQLELGPFFKNSANVFPTASITTELPKITCNEYAVIITTGHGFEAGIPTNGSHISPKAFVDSLRKISGLKVGLAVIGQCYGGIFNYLDAYTEPKLVLLGATNLNLSLSLPITINPPISGSVTEMGQDGKELRQDFVLDSWSANIFLYFFYEWLRKPLDIDGDGDKTIMDGFKYAGSKSNDRLRAEKAQTYINIDLLKSVLLSQLSQVKAVQQNQQALTKTFLDIDAARKQLDSQLEVLYLHQEPWILNANLARTVVF